MAGFGGRKGPNVSHYLSNLNAIPSDHDITSQQSEDFDFSTDLAAFTNTEFFDFDQGENVFQSPVDFDPSNQPLNATDPAVTQSNGKTIDFGMSNSVLMKCLHHKRPDGSCLDGRRSAECLASLRVIMASN